MEKLKYGFCFIMVATFLQGCAQEKYGIKKIVAFKTLRIAGTIPVDENGNSLYKGPDTVHTIYIEAGATKITWEKAWRNGNTYSIISEPIATPYNAGMQAGTGKKIVFTPSKGSIQWLLELSPKDINENPPRPLLSSTEILLSGKYGGKTIIQSIKKETELEALPVQ